MNSQRAVDDAMKTTVTGRLLDVWKANPDLRLMQLIGNVFLSSPQPTFRQACVKLEGLKDAFPKPVTCIFSQGLDLLATLHATQDLSPYYIEDYESIKAIEDFYEGKNGRAGAPAQPR